MSKLSNLFGQELSRQAGKAATEALWRQKNGANAYRLGGWIFVGCGVGWMLLSIIPIACKSPLSACIWMWILAAIQIIPGAIFIILSKRSKKFQEWADRDFEKDLIKKKKLEEKVKFGAVSLSMTYGDVLAFKILGVIAIMLIAALAVGTLQGWVVW
jgi:hypothetical protein